MDGQRTAVTYTSILIITIIVVDDGVGVGGDDSNI